MKFARIAIIIVAVAAALGAALLAKGMVGGKKQVAEQRPAVEIHKVLVADVDISVGREVKSGMLRWQDWPKSAISPRFITSNRNPKAKADFVGSTARAEVIAGEPILSGKLVKPGDSGFMAAILPAGVRAISVEIKPVTVAGGFILPNDRVDVIVTRRERGNGGSSETHISETVLTNVRVLAIGHLLQNGKSGSSDDSKEGQTATGDTATLALKPAHAERLALAEARGDISLVLRSMADAVTKASDDDLADFKKAGTVTVVRYGVSSQVSAKR